LKHSAQLFVFLVVINGLFSCDQKTESAHFYPIDSLVTGQIRNLTKIKAKLNKQALLDQKMDTIIYTPKDTLEWAEELDIFRELAVINKPVNKGRYVVKAASYDPGSNLAVKAFTTTENLPVKAMRIFYDASIDKPRKIEAEYSESNSLYSTSRTLSMEFQQIDNRTILTSYSVYGGQKMILSDSVSFSIRAKIQVD
jgi:hypothetical protein